MLAAEEETHTWTKWLTAKVLDFVPTDKQNHVMHQSWFPRSGSCRKYSGSELTDYIAKSWEVTKVHSVK